MCVCKINETNKSVNEVEKKSKLNSLRMKKEDHFMKRWDV